MIQLTWKILLGRFPQKKLADEGRGDWGGLKIDIHWHVESGGGGELKKMVQG